MRKQEDWKEEAQQFVDDLNDDWSFEKYCQVCDYYRTELCPHLGMVVDDTEWKKIGCDKFWD